MNHFPTEQAQIVYDRTYSRVKADGSRETWPDTVHRVAKGNLAFVYGDNESAWSDEVKAEYRDLYDHMLDFRILPAGRHLWATGVPGRQYISNCFVAPWGEKLSRHFSFMLLRLAEGGGVGANYSRVYTDRYPPVQRNLKVHIVCDPLHPNYQDLYQAGLISSEFHHEWSGSYQVEDSREGWSLALSDLLDTFTKDAPVKHQDRVYDVSRLRFKGAPLRSTGGVASGPEPFARLLISTAEILSARFGDRIRPLDLMEIDHEIGMCIVAAGTRRSARMSILRWDDPDILEFIACKRDPSKHWTTNISVEIDDQFIQAVDRGDERANLVLNRVVTGMLTNGEPGLWNSSLSNVGEPNPVVATNPCGEIALEETESCILGHVNLGAFWDAYPDEIQNAHRLMTRFLIRATFGDKNDAQQHDVVARNRRIGVGHFGVQEYLVKNGVKLSEPTRWFTENLEDWRESVETEAIHYCHDLRIPVPVKLTTVAPTGTIAKLAGTTEGIHPIYSQYFNRRIRFSTVDPKEMEQHDLLVSRGYSHEDAVNERNTVIVVIPTKDRLVDEAEAMGSPASDVESADQLTLEQMLSFQALYQRHYADNAVSFTANIAEPEFLPQAVREVTETLIPFLPQLKGTTLMVDGTRTQAPYERITKEAYEAATASEVADGTDEECASGACPVR